MIWLDAHLSPHVARWIREILGHDAEALRDIGLRDAEDGEIFDRGKQDDVIILTKNLPHSTRSFCELVSGRQREGRNHTSKRPPSRTTGGVLFQ